MNVGVNVNILILSFIHGSMLVMRRGKTEGRKLTIKEKIGTLGEKENYK